MTTAFSRIARTRVIDVTVNDLTTLYTVPSGRYAEVFYIVSEDGVQATLSDGTIISNNDPFFISGTNLTSFTSGNNNIKYVLFIREFNEV